MPRFQNRTVIVTGGAGGIGGATCRRCGAEGARVAVFDLNLEAADQVAADIRAAGGQALALRCDITDRASVAAAVAATEAQLGPIDVLVNNAGWDVFKPFTKTEAAEWDKLIAINLTGPLNLHHAVLPRMVERRAGRIVNIASDAARVGSTGEAVYAACKAGLLGFSKTLAREHAVARQGQRRHSHPQRLAGGGGAVVGGSIGGGELQNAVAQLGEIEAIAGDTA